MTEHKNKQPLSREQVLDLYVAEAQKLGRHPKRIEMEAVGVTREVIRQRFGSVTKMRHVLVGERPEIKIDGVLLDENGRLPEEVKSERLDIYVKFAVTNRRHPTIVELAELGISDGMIYRIWGNLTKMREAAKAHSPKSMAKILDGDLFTEERFEKLLAKVKSCKRFVITTAVTGCPVHPEFMASLDTYCKAHDAELLVLTSEDPASIAAHQCYVDPLLEDRNLVFKDLPLNKNCFISTIKLSAKHIRPTTGLGRIGQRNGSYIFASPKQQLDVVATSNNSLPHAVMTTGACTIAEYATDRYMSLRTAALALHDHVLGAIVVEIESEKIFHFRQVQFGKTGFADSGRLYTPKAITTYRPEAIIGGDLHDGESDEGALNAFVFGTESVTAVTKPKKLFVHDGFNGRSINHHEEKNTVLRARLASENHLSLEAELRHYANTLNRLAEYYEEIILVASNHDEFLNRYLAEGRYVSDPQNHRLALDLAAAYIDGKNPLQVAVERFGLKTPKKFRWLTRDEDVKIAGVECGAHGDKGANGAKGSLQSMEAAYGLSVSGHRHAPGILRGAFAVGTWSLIKLGYNVGASSWMHTACLIYPDGTRQLVNSIFGSWRSKPTRKVTA